MKIRKDGNQIIIEDDFGSQIVIIDALKFYDEILEEIRKEKVELRIIISKKIKEINDNMGVE